MSCSVISETCYQAGQKAATDTSSEEYEEEALDAEKFLQDKLGKHMGNNGYWEVVAHPLDFIEKRISDFGILKKMLTESQVRLRGWYFPPVDRYDYMSSFAKGIESKTKWKHILEGYRAFRSGQFVWRRMFCEDVLNHPGDGPRGLLFVSALNSITEFFLFFKRYYNLIAPECDLQYKIALHGVKDRQLIPGDEGILLRGNYVSHEDHIVVENSVSLTDLRASYKEIANYTIREVFQIFNWDNVTEQVIAQWQDKLLERKE